jgi:hypothetical protein
MTRRQRQKPVIVDGEPYLYWIRELPFDDADAVPLRVVLRADFGTRSFCTITGLTNREYWHDFPIWDPDVTISVTPKVVCNLIRFARTQGWNPVSTRTNFSIATDNASLSSIREDESG